MLDLRALLWFVSWTVFLPSVPSADPRPGAPDPHWERVAGAGRLWANIQLFHPAIPKDLDWDSVLVAVLPAIESAQDSAAYRTAIEAMIASLRDPATRVIPVRDSASRPRASRPPVLSWTEDSVAIVRVAGISADSGYEAGIAALSEVAASLGHARGVLVDGRLEDESAIEAIEVEWEAAGMNEALADTAVRVPAQQSRYHDGWRPAKDIGTGAYYGSGWRAQDGRFFTPGAGTVRRPTAFLANEHGWIPPIGLALHDARRAVLVSEGTATDAGVVRTALFSLPEGVQVQVRLSRLLNSDGTTGSPVDTSVASADTSGALALALRYAHGDSAPSAKRLGALPEPGLIPDRPYEESPYPDREHRMLAGFRIWRTMEYFHAYRALYEQNWADYLRDELPRLAAARDSLEYARAVSHFASGIHDAHGFVQSAALRAWRGVAPAPVRVEMVDGKAVVTFLAVDSVARASGLKLGDVVDQVDGIPARDRMKTLLEDMPGSTQWGMDRTAAASLLSGPDSSVAQVVVSGADGRRRTLQVPRSRAFADSLYNQRKGPILQLLPGNIGYADLDRMPTGMVDSMFAMFRDTRGIIFDMRGYPQGTAWSIAPHLTSRSGVVAARFARPLAIEPSAAQGDITDQSARVTFDQVLPPPADPYYNGPTVMLINEVTLSQAEHTGLFFEAANGTRFVGSPTAGANGDVTNLVVPGGILVWFSGHDVRHADGRQLQRVGLQPDVPVRPTIAGIRAGRDEVLEKAAALLRSRAASRPR